MHVHTESILSVKEPLLDSCGGVSHNIPLLHDIMENETYVAGKTNTDFIGNEYPNGFAVTTPTVAVTRLSSTRRARSNPSGSHLTAWRASPYGSRRGRNL